ncbi:MAG TPA: succinate dehydrogenase assembly factor 2 [Leucothrix mucor]|nr:succinate dehydrogenase assembly factor 2 [Leucothrix mucor]
MSQADHNRLRWKCRRGMLELDILLSSFLKNGYDTLDDADLERFSQLLDYEDNPLFELLMGKMQPADASFNPLLTLIRGSVVAAL